jgi:hypothetical protein
MNKNTPISRSHRSYLEVEAISKLSRSYLEGCLEASSHPTGAVRTHVATLRGVIGHLSAFVRSTICVNALEINVVAKIGKTMIVSWFGRFHA